MLDLKKTSSHNQNTITDFKIGILESSIVQLLETLEELAKETDLTIDEQNELKALIYRAYLKEKAGYFIESKLNGFLEYLSDACKMALKNKSNLNSVNDYTEITYLNHTKKLLSNEYI
jgi:hypothetical protein